MSDEQHASAREDLAAGTHLDAGAGRPEDSEQDLMADTERFRRFARDDEAEQPVETDSAVGGPFRLVSLAIGLVVLAILVWLLFL
jgi:hypothetical protein